MEIYSLNSVYENLSKYTLSAEKIYMYTAFGNLAEVC